MRMLCVLALLASTARAEKPTITVLGVVPKDPSLVKSTTALDAALRTRATAKASPYRAKGVKREIDAKLLAAECSTSEPACAAKLGAALGAEYALAGELEKRGTHVELVLSLVDVAKQQRIRTFRDKVAGNADMRKLARAGFDKLTGITELGELALVANAQRGDVYLDGELVGALFEGRTTITRLVQGKHRLEIRANGYRPFDVEIDIEGAVKQSVLLEPL